MNKLLERINKRRKLFLTVILPTAITNDEDLQIVLQEYNALANKDLGVFGESKQQKMNRTNLNTKEHQLFNHLASLLDAYKQKQKSL